MDTETDISVWLTSDSDQRRTAMLIRILRNINALGASCVECVLSGLPVRRIIKPCPCRQSHHGYGERKERDLSCDECKASF